MRREVHAALAADRPDLLHTNNLAGFSVSAWLAADELGIPIVHTIRDYYLSCVRSTRQKNEANCATTCAECTIAAVPRRSASGVVSSVIGNSRFVLDMHASLGQFRNARLREVIYNAYAPEFEGGERVGNDGGVLRVGYLGRLHPTKGVEVLIDAVAACTQLRMRVSIAGTGNSTYVE
jgi:glycosyltransferase involved in cell wall biosynthesis